MGKELTVHSDLAYEFAHRLSEARGESVEAVVEAALRDMICKRVYGLAEDDGFSEEAIARRRAERDALIAWINRDYPPGVSSNHTDLYDENGLPI